MKRISHTKLIFTFVSAICSSILFAEDSNDIELLNTAAPQEVPTQTIKIISSSKLAALFCLAIDTYFYHRANTIQPHNTDLINLEKVLWAGRIATTIPELCLREMDADLYFGLRTTAGVIDFGWMYYRLKEYKLQQPEDAQWLLLLSALLNLDSAIEKFQQAYDYFVQGKEPHEILPWITYKESEKTTSAGTANTKEVNINI